MTQAYDILKDLEGQGADIVAGHLVPSSQGILTISRTPAPMTAYVNDRNRSVTPIVPRSAFIGRQYLLRRQDCVSLFAEWHDQHFGTALLPRYRGASNAEFKSYYSTTLQDWFSANGFVKVTDPSIGDCVFYNYSNDEPVRNHLGVYLGDGKLLHHLPGRLSSIDPLYPERILAVYRYGNP